jgi:hypothetical protein
MLVKLNLDGQSNHWDSQGWIYPGKFTELWGYDDLESLVDKWIGHFIGIWDEVLLMVPPHPTVAAVCIAVILGYTGKLPVIWNPYSANGSGGINLNDTAKSVWD